MFDEKTFRGLVRREQARAMRRGEALCILTIGRYAVCGTLLPMEEDVSLTVLSVLQAAVRETDVVGWYRAQHLAAAMLLDARPDTKCDCVVNRVLRRLEAALPLEQYRSLRIRLGGDVEAALES